jgi:hypothetical protein
MQGSGDGSIGQPSRREKWPQRTESGDPRSRILPVATRSSRNNPLVNSEPVTLVVPPDVDQPQVQDIDLTFQDVTATTGPYLSDAESQELEELLTSHGDIFL